MAGAGPRPFGVVLVVILIVLGALAMLVNGVLGLVNGGQGGAGIAVSIVLIVVGLVYLLVAKGVFSGNNGARLLVAIVTVFALVGSLWSAVSEAGTRISSLAEAAVALIILYLLFAPKARAFFA